MRWKKRIYRRTAAALIAVLCICCLGPVSAYGDIVPLSGSGLQEGAGRGTPPEAEGGIKAPDFEEEEPRPGSQSELDPEPAPPVAPGMPIAPLSSKGTPSEMDDASDYEEMKAWMAANSKTGGTLYLTGDIVIEGDEMIHRGPGTPQMTVDTGEYSIIVRGQLYLAASSIKFAGDGGSRGVLRIEEGGILHIDMLGGISAREGVAVFQEDGAFFGHYPEYAPVDGEIRAPSVPAAVSMTPVQNGAPSLVVEAGESGVEKAAEALPGKTQRAAICKDGLYLMMDEDCPVEWDLNAVEEALSNRQRATVYGDFYFAGDPMADLKTVNRPYCHVVFTDRAATFLGVNASVSSSGSLKIIGQYLVEGGPCVVAPLISYDDGETWQEMEGQEERYDGEGRECTLALWSQDARPFSLCLEIRRQGEPPAYSDVLKWEDGEIAPGRDYEGNRGGGLQIGGGGTLPPIPGYGSEKPQNPGGDPNPEAPQPPDKAPNSDGTDKPDRPGAVSGSSSHQNHGSAGGVYSQGDGGKPTGPAADSLEDGTGAGSLNEDGLEEDGLKENVLEENSLEIAEAGGMVPEAVKAEEAALKGGTLMAGGEPGTDRNRLKPERERTAEGEPAAPKKQDMSPPSAAVQILAGLAALALIFGGALWLKPGVWIRKLQGFLKKDR